MEMVRGFVSGRPDYVPTDLLPLGVHRALLGAGATRLPTVPCMPPRVLISGRLWVLGGKSLGRGFIAACHKPPSIPHPPQGSPVLSPIGINGRTGAKPNTWAPPSWFSFCSLHHPALITKRYSKNLQFLSQKSSPKYFLWNSLDCKHFSYLFSLFAESKNFLRVLFIQQ